MPLWVTGSWSNAWQATHWAEKCLFRILWWVLPNHGSHTVNRLSLYFCLVLVYSAGKHLIMHPIWLYFKMMQFVNLAHYFRSSQLIMKMAVLTRVGVFSFVPRSIQRFLLCILVFLSQHHLLCNTNITPGLRVNPFILVSSSITAKKNYSNVCVRLCVYMCLTCFTDPLQVPS